MDRPFPPPGPLAGVVDLSWGLRGATVSLVVRSESPLDAYILQRIGAVVGKIEELTTLLDLAADRAETPRRLTGQPVHADQGPE